MEDFLIGFMACLMVVITFTLGFICGKGYNKTSNNKEATVTTTEDNLKKEKLRRQKGFNNIMNYDISVAMGDREQFEE